nr:hypothetical protein Iba_chr10eCG10690 [Ipomoea batatas]
MGDNHRRQPRESTKGDSHESHSRETTTGNNHETTKGDSHGSRPWETATRDSPEVSHGRQPRESSNGDKHESQPRGLATARGGQTFLTVQQGNRRKKREKVKKGDEGRRRSPEDLPVAV